MIFFQVNQLPNPKKRLLGAAIVLFMTVTGLIYIAWINNAPLQDQNSKRVLASIVRSDKHHPTITDAKVVTISEYDKVIDLLTGNYLQQKTPKNLKEDDFSSYSQVVKYNWNSYTKKMGQPMMNWSAFEINQSVKKVFYPFSGPDFTTAYQLFPHADHYVMVAQQRGERLVDLTKLNRFEAIQAMNVFSSAWNSFGQDGFFVTEYLFKYISQHQVKIGATTLIASFAHLHQFSIEKIIPLRLNAFGELEELSTDAPWDSVRFYLTKDNHQVILDYVRMDLSNHGMVEAPQQVTFFEAAAKSAILLKAASHLPQNKSFTIVRDAMLKNAPLVVQDETGIDYSPLNQTFDTVLYGRFIKPYRVFSNYNRELAKAYLTRQDEKPLPFRVGYFKDGNYALIVATRKPGFTGLPLQN